MRGFQKAASRERDKPGEAAKGDMSLLNSIHDLWWCGCRPADLSIGPLADVKLRTESTAPRGPINSDVLAAWKNSRIIMQTTLWGHEAFTSQRGRMSPSKMPEHLQGPEENIRKNRTSKNDQLFSSAVIWMRHEASAKWLRSRTTFYTNRNLKDLTATGRL